MMKFKFLAVLTIALFLTLFVAVCFSAQDQPSPSAVFPQTSYQFSPVLDGAKVVHDFVIQNKGTTMLKVKRVKTG
jgi:hypothetical protein